MNKVTVNMERCSLHRQFWKAENTDETPASFRLGDYFFADKFSAALPILKPGLKIEQEMLHVDAYLKDYECMFQNIEQIGQSGFWTAEPYTGIPWMEAILGCPVYADEHSFISEPAESLPEPDVVENLPTNAWFLKYMEFTEKLVILSNGRFPIGQPIMRGIADVIGAIMGQSEMVFAMYDEPETIEKLASIILKTFLKISEEQSRIIPAFQGGASIGFYHLWTPGSCIWFQDDLTAILSPELYRSYILPCHATICDQAEHSLIHLHSSSFHILDDILNIDSLEAVEINKDIGGPSILEMIPQFKKVLKAGKRLVIWGTLNEQDIATIQSELPRQGVFLNIISESQARAVALRKLL